MATQTDLELEISSLALVDTHEHLLPEDQWAGDNAKLIERMKEAGESGWGDDRPDILQDLFMNYVPSDLEVAGATKEAIQRLFDRRLEELRRPAERLRLLREVAGLDHVQIDDFQWACEPDASGPGFFLYDLSWAGFANGDVKLEEIQQETGIQVSRLDDLREALVAIFRRYAPCAIAVKAQHAYTRTLRWEERSDEEAARALAAALAGGKEEATRLALGDWCWARGVELAVEHNLPFKLHTGHHAGTGQMPIDWVRAGNLCPLLARYPEARFVLMHTSYPYSDELVSIAKHYPNVWVDLCWAWSIDPYSSADFVRRFLHTVPSNKLFGFGGDTFWPTAAIAYSIQARRGLQRALEAEIAEGDLTEPEAITIARRLMRDNQYACFDIEGTRAAIRAQLQPAGVA